MPNTTVYSFGDVVLAPFPFTDQTATKKRPAVVVSSDGYNKARPDLILMAITGHLSGYPRIGEVVVSDWKRGWVTQSFNYQANSHHCRNESNHSNLGPTQRARHFRPQGWLEDDPWLKLTALCGGKAGVQLAQHILRCSLA